MGYISRVACLLCLWLLACSDKPPPVPTEIPSSPRDSFIYSSSSGEGAAAENELLENAKRLFAASLYTAAKREFEQLRDNYPFGPYSEYAELKIADCHLLLREHEAASSVLEEFIKQHPSSPSLPYAMLMAGRSAQLTNRGVGRDSAPLEKAATFYDALIKRFPESVYAVSAAEFKTETMKQLAAYDLYVAELYKKLGKEAAYQARSKKLEQRWSSVAEVKNIFNNQVPETPQLIRAERERTEPDAPVLMAAMRPEALAQNKLEAKLETIGADIKQPTKLTLPEPDAESHRNRVLTTQCSKTGTGPSFLVFERALAANDISHHTTPQGSVITLKDVAIDPANIKSCPGLSLTVEAGELVTSSDISLLTLSNPPRLMLLPK